MVPVAEVLLPHPAVVTTAHAFPISDQQDTGFALAIDLLIERKAAGHESEFQ